MLKELTQGHSSIMKLKFSNLSIFSFYFSLSMCKIFMRYFYILLWFFFTSSSYSTLKTQREEDGNTFIIMKSMKFIDDIKRDQESIKMMKIVENFFQIQMH